MERFETAKGLELSGSDAPSDVPLVTDAWLSLRLKTCIVPLLLEAASHWAVELNARL